MLEKVKAYIRSIAVKHSDPERIERVVDRVSGFSCNEVKSLLADSVTLIRTIKEINARYIIEDIPLDLSDSMITISQESTIPLYTPYSPSLNHPRASSEGT